MKSSLTVITLFASIFFVSCSKSSGPSSGGGGGGGSTTTGPTVYTSVTSTGAGAGMPSVKTDFNSPFLGSGVVGGNMYIGGGDIVGALTSSVNIYSVAANSWTTIQMDTARDGMAVDTLGSKIFFAGGYKGNDNYSSEVDIYDGSGGTWTTAALSEAKFGFAVASAGTKIVFAGGSTYYTGVGNEAEQPTNTVDIYDGSTSQWSSATLSVARNYLTAVSSGTKIFFAGGYDGTAFSNVVDIYDVSANTWTTATLSTARGFLASSASGSEVLFAGGVTGGTNGAAYAPSSVVDIYNTTTATWTTSSLSEARGSLASTTNGNLIFFGGGNLQNNNGPSATVDIYNVTTNQWLAAMQLSTARQDLAAASYNGIVVFAGGDDGTAVVYNTVDLFTAH